MGKLATICPACQTAWDKFQVDYKAGKVKAKDSPRNPSHGVEQLREFNLGTTKFISFSCGHTIKSDLLKAKTPFAVEAEDGKVLWQYQQDTLQFMQAANFRALLNLDMGLGKTPITCAAFRAFPELLPAIIVCKSSLKHQWARMLMNWADIIPEIVENGKDTLNPRFFKVAVVSFDLLRRLKIDDETRQRYKTIVIDETQNIKSPDTKRTQEVRKLAKGIPYCLGLSGTPIKNNGTEYFTILNILRSDMFHNYNTFCWNWVENFWDGYRFKYGGIKRYAEFKERTKNFIIRYTRDEVMPDLPKIFRQEQFHELGPEVSKAYQKEMDRFNEAYDSGEFNGTNGFMDMLAYMSRMRHLTGLAKIKPTIDYLESFLLETDRKIVVFCHHKDVMELLKKGLESRAKDEETGDILFEPPVMYTSDLSSEQRDNVVENFKSGTARIMIASTLSLQEGVNLQPVADCIMLERQWNPANEEQAEARFPRPGSTADKINAIYMIAIGTIDEYFAELVEKKRQICQQSLGNGEAVKWEETSLMRELASILAAKGNKKWTL